MKNDEVIVSKKLIENIIKVLSFTTDRGFNCFKDEETLINTLKQCINNMKEKQIELILSSTINFNKEDLVICNVEILKQLRNLLKERYDEYDLLIQQEFVYSNKRILAEIKNRRDEFTIGGEIYDIIEKYNKKNKNLKELIYMLNKNEKVILEIEHSDSYMIDKNELRIQIPTKIISFNKESVVIGNKLCCYELETGIHFQFMLNDIETINKTMLLKGFELNFYNNSCPPISFLFDKKD